MPPSPFPALCATLTLLVALPYSLYVSAPHNTTHNLSATASASSFRPAPPAARAGAAEGGARSGFMGEWENETCVCNCACEREGEDLFSVENMTNFVNLMLNLLFAIGAAIGLVLSGYCYCNCCRGLFVLRHEEDGGSSRGDRDEEGGQGGGEGGEQGGEGEKGGGEKARNRER